jgi:hypothetical protein
MFKIMFKFSSSLIQLRFTEAPPLGDADDGINIAKHHNQGSSEDADGRELDDDTNVANPGAKCKENGHNQHPTCGREHRNPIHDDEHIRRCQIHKDATEEEEEDVDEAVVPFRNSLSPNHPDNVILGSNFGPFDVDVLAHLVSVRHSPPTFDGNAHANEGETATHHETDVAWVG